MPRCRHEIIKDVLEACLKERNLNSLLVKANISSTTGYRLIDLLEKHGLLAERKEENYSKKSSSRFFKTTSKGRKYLEYFRKTVSLIEKSDRINENLINLLLGKENAEDVSPFALKFRSVGFFWDVWTCSKVLQRLKSDFPDKRFRVRLEIVEILGMDDKMFEIKSKD